MEKASILFNFVPQRCSFYVLYSVLARGRRPYYKSRPCNLGESSALISSINKIKFNAPYCMCLHPSFHHGESLGL